ncbi:3294_t:CDS:2 [Cetraspora pellucida]|uniref:3294_t:CDS:1 n=1 Tax=Cetraspora pellucida TaxID=1433469 RepID=A0ACA9LV32_9GLOM|nr:3294_t:CDS:2 [Cetraspora pellucida]
MLDITGLFDESLEAIRSSKYNDQDSSRNDFDYDDTQLKDLRRHFKIILNNHPPKYCPPADFTNNDDLEFERLIKIDNNAPFNYGPGNFDVIICVGEEPNVERFRSHSVILSKRSSYFRTALSSTWAKKCGNIFFFEKPNMSPKVFTSILRYLYIGKIKLERLDIKTLLDIMIASDELVLQDLIDQIQDHFIYLHTDLLTPYLIFLIITCYNNPSFEKLLPDWIDKGKSIMSAPKPKKHSNRFLFPFFKRRNNSKNSLSSPSKKIHYTLDLLFRMTRDGPSAYHDRCLKQGPTLVIAKIRCPSKTIIVGGYNPVGFNYSFNIDISSLSQTFIFSFGNGEGLEKPSMVRVQTDWSRMAIKFSSVGLCFGYDDLTINFKERSCEFSKYFFELVECETSELAECEVFHVLESIHEIILPNPQIYSTIHNIITFKN